MGFNSGFKGLIMTKFENSWGIHMREGLAENSLSQLEGG